MSVRAASPVTHELPATSSAEEGPVRWALGVLLIVGGVLGIIASFALTMDKFLLLEHPGAALSCNVNDVIQCGTNLEAWQGRVFGFPNPLLGLLMFPAPVFVGAALLGRVRFPRWFWVVFNAGLVFALGFVIWLVGQSFWVLYTFCPWCGLVYFAVIPMALAVTFYNLREGNLSSKPTAQRLGAVLFTWTPLISLSVLVVVLICAQVQLDIVSQIF